MKARICDICGDVIGKSIWSSDPMPQMIVKMKNANDKYEKLELCSNCKYNLFVWCRNHKGYESEEFDGE